MSESPQLHTIVCEEVFDENSVPSEEEVLEYAAKIGIDTKTEHHLLPIALNGLMHPLPPEWKPCFDSELKKWYYYNLETKRSQWEHPLDPLYRQIVRRGRSEGYSSAGDDDSKTTAKEDLKSFEEASDILSSRSADIKPEAGVEKKDNTAMNERGPLLKGSQPLLLRRKQLQSGQDPFHVAKLINSTLRQSLPKDEEPSIQRRSLSDLPPPVPALRRSHTSDLITTHPPPIKGILRESSFSGSMSTSNKGSSGRYGDNGTLLQDPEDEKKRSVRFADFERKSVDIRFQLSDSEEIYSDVDDDDNDDDPSSESPEVDKDAKEMTNETKPKILSPLKKSDSSFNFVSQRRENSDPPRIPKKFTVTPVKDPPFGYPISELKGLFRTESVGPLDSDSDLSSGIKGGESLTTGISRLNEIESNVLKKSEAELDLFGPKINDSKNSPVKLKKQDEVEVTRLKSPPTLTDIHDQGEELVILDLDLKKVRTESVIDVTDYVSALSLQDVGSNEAFTKQKSDELLRLQEKLETEFEEKAEELKSLQKNKLSNLKEDLKMAEEAEVKKLKEELQENLKKLIANLEAEYKLKENELRDLHKLELENLSKQLQIEREKEIEAMRIENREAIKIWKQEEDKALKEERIRLDNESFERMQKNKTELIKKLDELRTHEESQIEELTKINEKRLDEIKLKYEEIIKELNMRHQNEIKEIEESHKLRIEVMRKDKESELKRCEGEWEDRVTAMALSQKARLESVGKEHEGRLARLRADWEREESEMRRRRTPFDQQSVPVDYEKLRCEKRLLEDKYRTLKEKYCQLKTDMKIAVEKKLQARAKRKKDELDRSSGPPERPKNLNTEMQPASLIAPRITVGEVSPRDVTDPSSDDQYTLSSNLPEKYGGHKKSRSLRREHTPTGCRTLEETKSHLEELEGKSGDICLHHPLNSLGLSRSSEIDYYRQRLIAEEEQARATRECLEDQRRSLEARGAMENNNTLLGLHQERDLNELEVSLHRTRQFFGEKMIRLRLLGQTLSRLADDTTSPPYNSGEGSSVATSNVLQNLDNINAEIREIWNQLNKNQISGVNNASGMSEVYYKSDDKPRVKSSHHHQPHRSSKRSEIQARLQGLQDWLQTPPPADWAQLTL